MRAGLLWASLFVVTAAGCTSLLGSYEVQPGAATDGGGGGSDGAPADGPTSPDAATDGAIAQADAGCTAPRPTQCGAACVNLDLDDKNCGACGASCFGGNCVARVCLPSLLIPRTDIAANTLTATDQDLLFGVPDQVIDQPLGGMPALPPPIRLLPGGTPAADVFGIATLGGTVFFTRGTGTANQWQLWQATAGTASSGAPRNGAVNGRPDGLVAVATNGNVFTQNVAVGASTDTFYLLTCSAPSGSACAANYPGAVPGNRIVGGNGYVFWTDQHGTVHETADAIGLLNTIGTAAGEGTATAAAWDGTSLFWVQNDTSKIRRSPFPGSAPADFRTITTSVSDLVVDAANVYYAMYEPPGYTLYATPKGAPPITPPRRVATGNIPHLAQNSQALFWVEADGVHVVRKPGL
jgi:hypothetical protein